MSAGERVLGWAVRLLPERRRGWGLAMRAELAQLESRGERRSFVLGCVMAVLRHPTVWLGLRYPVLLAATLTAGVLWSAQIAYAPLRTAVFAMLAVLIGLLAIGRWKGFLGPVRADRPARGIRAIGVALVAVLAIRTIGQFVRAVSSFDESAGTAAPIYTTIFGCYLCAFLAVTAQRSAAQSQNLATAGRAAAIAVAGWTVISLLWPPLPTTGAFALLAVSAAIFIAIGRAAGGGGQRVLAALTAGTLASLVIFTLVTVVLLRIPRWVPDIGGWALPASLTAAQRLQENQAYAVDPYIPVLMIGAILAAVLAVASMVLRRRAGSALAGQRDGHPQAGVGVIELD
ncbi:hypothetical protein [Rhizocola hellebori]|uniref:hypothetical protein n=1 Tax=Rhizocola hellebori TaxID=1392758 RepID=UPI0019405203|nr:hypothetical protein [Rhizocola hellebori]